MPDPLAPRPDAAVDAALEVALRDLAGAIAFPPVAATGPDLASRVRHSIEAHPRPGSRSRWGAVRVPRARPLRWSLALALVALALLTALVGAAILGVPGIRIVLTGGAGATAEPSASVRPSPGLPLGSGAGLGEPVALDEATTIVGFEPQVPAALGPPDATWVSGKRLSLVWESGTGLPELAVDGAGLLITEFRGRVGDGYFQKQVDDATTVERVMVAGRPGYWLSGRPHVLVYVDGAGRSVEETRRIVGDALFWEVDGLTFRIESGLGRDETIDLAEQLAPEG